MGMNMTRKDWRNAVLITVSVLVLLALVAFLAVLLSPHEGEDFRVRNTGCVATSDFTAEVSYTAEMMRETHAGVRIRAEVEYRDSMGRFLASDDLTIQLARKDSASGAETTFFALAESISTCKIKVKRASWN